MAEDRWTFIAVDPKMGMYIFSRPILDEYLKSLNFRIEEARKVRDDNGTDLDRGYYNGLGMAYAMYVSNDD